MSWVKPTDEICPKCGQSMVEKGNKKVCWNEECGHIVEKEEK